MAHKKDTRFVYGVGCTWFGPIQAVGVTPPATMVINGKKVLTPAYLAVHIAVDS